MMKHAEKVSMLQQRLESFSRGLFTAGIIFTCYASYCFLTYRASKASTSSSHKLGSSHESSSSDEADMAPVFNGISIAIWSMVAAKAKAGLSAASSGEHKTVKDYLWQAGALMFMVAAASCFNIYSSQMN